MRQAPGGLLEGPAFVPARAALEDIRFVRGKIASSSCGHAYGNDGDSDLSDIEQRTAGRWSELCAQNPRLFDGPVLSLESFDGCRGGIRVDTYRRLCVQPEVPTGVVQLSVTGAITANLYGERAVLLGKRGAGTRVHGGMWELAPSGGVDVPGDPGWTSITGDVLRGQLVFEAVEELGIDHADALGVFGDDAVCVGMAIDRIACSADVVIQAEVSAELAALLGSGACADNRDDGKRNGNCGDSGSTANWEYDEVRWIPESHLSAFIDAAERDGVASRLAPQLVPPLVPTLRALGLLG